MKASWDNYRTPLDLPDAFTLALPKAATIGGIVVDADGKLVAGASVTLSIRMDGLPEHVASGTSYRGLTTDAAGHWTYAEAPATWKAIDVGAYDMTRGGNEAGFYNMPDVDAAGDVAALRAGTFASTLAPVRLVTGRVTDADGQPIAGAEIGIGTDRVASNALPSVKTDADGRYAIGGKPDAALTLTFTAKGHAPQLAQFTNSASVGEVNETLQPAKTLAGRVVDADGKPVAGAHVFVDTWRGTRTLKAQRTADADGRFTWENAPADPVMVTVDAMGFAYKNNTPMSPDQANVITLAKPVTFVGRAVDAETKQPVTSFTPIVGIVFDKSQTPSFQRSGGTDDATPSADGAFKLTFSYPYPGRVVRVEAYGYAPADSPIVTMTDGDQQFTYELHRAAGLAGDVVGPDGKPAANANVYLAIVGAPIRLTNGEVGKFDRREVIQRTTDADGHFAFPPQPGPFILVASGNAGFAQVDSTSWKAADPIALKPWASVSGTALIGKTPARDATIQAYAPTPYDPKQPNVSSALAATTDADGRFSIDHVPPGAWKLGRQIAIGEQMSTTTGTRAIDAQPGASLTIQIGGNGRPVDGHVELPPQLKGRSDWAFLSFDLATKIEQPKLPKPMAEIQAMTEAERKAFGESPEARAFEKAQADAFANQKRYPAWVKPDGSYHIDDVEPGTYQITGQIMQKPARPDVRLRRDARQRKAHRRDDPARRSVDARRGADGRHHAEEDARGRPARARLRRADARRPAREARRPPRQVRAARLLGDVVRAVRRRGAEHAGDVRPLRQGRALCDDQPQPRRQARRAEGVRR